MTVLTVPNVRLNNGVEIPQLGFGVFQIKPEDTVEAVTTALEVGYRHIDTAEMYRNEKEVGEAIATSGIDPSEIFVTSKLNNNKHDFDDALAAFDQTLADLRLDRIDLFLIHWPLPKVGDFVRDLEGPGAGLLRRAAPGPSASRTSSRTTCAGCTRRPPSFPRSTRSSCIRT